MIERPLYMNRLHYLRGQGVVKVITGVRRCGKTSLMALVRQQLLKEGVGEQRIVHVDFERISQARYKSREEFVAHVLPRLLGPDGRPDDPRYLFVDEVQELQDWAEVVNGLRAECNVDIYVSGSNSRAFAGEKMTYLSGRYVRLEVYPLSLPEWCSFKGIAPCDPVEIERAYNAWADQGGFPAVALADGDELRRALLDGIFESVFTRDIILRGGIRNEAAFMRVASFVLDNVGNQTSANAISKALCKGGHKITPDTVDSYLDLMCKAHLLYRCDRYDLRGKERLKTNGKYYTVDSGLRRRVLGPGLDAMGHLTENMVYLELLRRGYEVVVGTLPTCEIDFVAEKDGRRVYLQVSETVVDPQTRAREFKPFTQLNDAWPCVLITKDRESYPQAGVRHLNFYDFMAGDEW